MTEAAGGHDNVRTSPDPRASPAASVRVVKSRETAWPYIAPAQALLSDDMVSSVPALSLKARENAALSLKRIFDQAQLHLHSSPSTDGELADTTDDTDGRERAAPTSMVTAADPDLELRLAISAPPSTSYTTFGNSGGSGQLTIFYAGTTCVYESVPADKARAIMLLASGSGDMYSFDADCTHATARVNRSRPTTPVSRSITPDPQARRSAKAVRRSQAELPFARKASLARFLGRRKQRIEGTTVFPDGHKTSSSESPPKRQRLSN